MRLLPLCLLFLIPLSTSSLLPSSPEVPETISYPSLSSYNPGIKITILQAGLSQALIQYTPILQQQILNLQIPDVTEGSNPEIKLSQIKISSLDLSPPVLTIKDDGFIFNIKDVSINLSADWAYRIKEIIVIKDSGSLDATDSNASITGTISVTLIDGQPVVEIHDVQVSIGSLSLQIHGSWVSWLYDALIAIIKPFVTNTINTQIAQAVEESLTDGVNQLIASIGTQYDLDGVGSFVYAFMDSCYTTYSLVDFGISATFQSASDPSARSPFMAAVLPTESNTQVLQLFIDEATFESLFWVFYEDGLLDYLITPDLLPSNFPIQLNTFAFKLFIPSLYNAYPDWPMTIFAKATEAATLQITDSSLNINLQTLWDFNVVDNTTNVSTTAFTLNVGIKLAGNVGFTVNSTTNSTTNTTINTTAITLEASSLSTTMSLNSSTIGTFSPFLLQTTVNVVASTFLLPTVNKLGAQGFPLPLPQILNLVQPQLDKHAGYVVLSTNFTLEGLEYKDIEQIREEWAVSGFEYDRPDFEYGYRLDESC